MKPRLMVIIRWAFGILMGVGILAVGITALNNGPGSAGDAGSGAVGASDQAFDSQAQPDTGSPDTGSPGTALALEQLLAQQAEEDGAALASCRPLEGALLQQILETLPPGVTLEQASAFGDPDAPVISVELSGPVPLETATWAAEASGAGVQVFPVSPTAQELSNTPTITVPPSTLSASESCLQ